MKRLLKHLQCGDRDVTVVFLDDEGIREYNRTYLKRDRPTNVLSFSMTEGAFGDLNPLVLGDILISAERAAKEAPRSRLSVEAMLDYLMIHGLLHLLGYDHETSREAAVEMKRKEKELFFLLNNDPIHAGRIKKG